MNANSDNVGDVISHLASDYLTFAGACHPLACFRLVLRLAEHTVAAV